MYLLKIFSSFTEDSKTHKAHVLTEEKNKKQNIGLVVAVSIGFNILVHELTYIHEYPIIKHAQNPLPTHILGLQVEQLHFTISIKGTLNNRIKEKKRTILHPYCFSQGSYK